MNPSPIRRAVLRALGKFGGRSRDLKTGAAIQRSWKEIVGELMSRYCHPLQVNGHRLSIGVTSPVWLAEVEFLKDTLLDNIQKALGEKAIREVSFCMIEEAPKPLAGLPQFEKPVFEEPSPETSLRLEEALTKIGDPDLREQVRRVLKKSLSRYTHDRTGSPGKGT